MKKVEMLDKLDEWGVKFDPQIKWKDLQKLYKEEKIQHKGDDFGLYHEDHQPDPPKELSVREALEKDIVVFMKSIEGKTNGTRGEIDRMFQLYNQYFNRVDSPGCSACVGRVFKKMKNLYKTL